MRAAGHIRSHKAQENRVVNDRSRGTADLPRRPCAITAALSCEIAAGAKAVASSVESRVLHVFIDVSSGWRRVAYRMSWRPTMVRTSKQELRRCCLADLSPDRRPDFGRGAVMHTVVDERVTQGKVGL